MSTYSNLYIQIIFAVKGRQSLISPTWEDELFKYITGIVQKKGHKMLAINGVPDHIHFFIGMNPSCTISDLVREVKKCSNEFVKQNNLTNDNFSWQDGYGAFSYGKSDIDRVVKYIMNQKEHHKKQSFKEEFLLFLQKYQIEYDEKYLFEWIND
jgi:REP element-mobilizing transposase RayT